MGGLTFLIPPHNDGTRAFLFFLCVPFADVLRTADGFTVVRYQREVGAGYFDEVVRVVSSGLSSVTAMAGSRSSRRLPKQKEDGVNFLDVGGNLFRMPLKLGG